MISHDSVERILSKKKFRLQYSLPSLDIFDTSSVIYHLILFIIEKNCYFLPKNHAIGGDGKRGVVVLKWLRGSQDVELVMTVLTGWWSISNGYDGSRWWPCLWRLDVRTTLPGPRVASHAPVMINSPSSAAHQSPLSQWTNSVRHTVKSTSLLSPSQLQNDQQDCDPCSDFPQPAAAGIFQSNSPELVSVWTMRWSQLLPADRRETRPFWLIFVVPVGSDNNADDSHYHQADCVYSYNFISSNQSQDRRKKS